MTSANTTTTTPQFSNTTQNVSGSSAQAPWSVQSPHIQNAFANAYQNYLNTLQRGPWTGDFIALDANMGGQNNQVYQNMYNMGTNPALMNQMLGTVNSGAAMSNAGMGNYNAGASALAGLSGNNMGQIIGGATDVANSPFISDAVMAAMSDANRNAREAQVPNLYRAAAASNNLNSSQNALQQGVIDRGLNDLSGNISATMRQNMYSQGLQTALGQLQNQTQAASSLGNLGLGGYSAGLQGQGAGLNNAMALNNMALQGAQGRLSLGQQNLDNELAKYNQWINFPTQALNQYYGLIGANNWGSQGTTNASTTGSSFGSGGQTTQQNQPGLLGILGTLAGGVGSLFGAPAGGLSPIQGISNFFNPKP